VGDSIDVTVGEVCIVEVGWVSYPALVGNQIPKRNCWSNRARIGVDVAADKQNEKRWECRENPVVVNERKSSR